MMSAFAYAYHVITLQLMTLTTIYWRQVLRSATNIEITLTFADVRHDTTKSKLLQLEFDGPPAFTAAWNKQGKLPQLEFDGSPAFAAAWNKQGKPPQLEFDGSPAFAAAWNRQGKPS